MIGHLYVAARTGYAVNDLNNQLEAPLNSFINIIRFNSNVASKIDSDWLKYKNNWSMNSIKRANETLYMWKKVSDALRSEQVIKI